MKIYVAWGSYDADDLFDALPRVLLSYNDIINGTMGRYMERAQATGKDVFLDSGAFGAMSVGAKINLADYIAYIQAKRPRLYANLDVIKDAVATLTNQKEMERHGLKPIPCFHIGEPTTFLRAYLVANDYIALGVAGKQSTKEGRAFLDACFAIIKEYWPKRIHGFGITGQVNLLRYPFFSVDSRSALTGAAYGQVFGFARGAVTVGSYKDPAVGGRKFGCVDGQDHKHISRAANNAAVMKRLEEYVTQVWEKRGITWHD